MKSLHQCRRKYMVAKKIKMVQTALLLEIIEWQRIVANSGFVTSNLLIILGFLDDRDHMLFSILMGRLHVLSRKSICRK